MSEETTNQQDREMTPEELKAYKDNQHKYYKEQLPFLKTTLEYEKLIADIEEARLKYFTMRMRIGHLLAPPSPEEERAQRPDVEASPEAPVRKERKLKSQE